MSENSTPEERTEDPTSKRMNDLRKQGQVHVSTEVGQVLSLLSGFLVLFATWSWMLEDMKQYIQTSFFAVHRYDHFTRYTAFDIFLEAFQIFAPHVALTTIVIAVISVLATMLQTGWNVKEKWIEMRWSFLNPIEGVKKVFSYKGLVQTAKSLLKLVLILPIGYFALVEYAPEMVGLIHMSVEKVFSFTGEAIFALFWKILYVLIAFAIFDYFWTRYMWFRDNRMTKEEVKDERKSTEGDEATKRKIQSKGLQRIMERIQNSVPQADVVITNPTHYAIALQYDRENMGAPKVVAKGKNFLAQRIKKIARESSVPIVERKALARALYASTEVGSEIPRELFKAVAEILAYVYRLKNPFAHQQQPDPRSP